MQEVNVSRREALKKFGASAAAAGALSTGTVSAGGTLEVHMWPQRSSDRDEVDNEIGDALTHFLDQLYTNNAIDGWSLTYDANNLKEEFGITYDGDNCDTGGWFYDFQQAVSNEDGDVHIAVTDQTNFANASGECWGSNGPGYAFVGTAGGYSNTTEDVQRYKNLAKQEVGHVIINEDHISGSLDHPEHALGKVRYNGDSTPMVTFYEDSPDYNPCADLGEESSNGNCSSTYSWDGGHQKDVTQCAIDAVKATNQNDGY
jgi:hypothetical protein